MAESEASGTMAESTTEFNGREVVVANSEYAIRMSLCKPKHRGPITVLQPLPEKPPLPHYVSVGIPAAVYQNSVFVCGLGNRYEEIWRLDSKSSKWSKCASLIQGRCLHCVAFVDNVLFICGGQFNDPMLGRIALSDVETYKWPTFDDRCSKIGTLAHGVCASGNCVPHKASLYIFGGRDAKGTGFSIVQVYDTKSNTCTVLRNQMPRACGWLFGELWENSVILLGREECFIYDIDTQTWKVRDKFKCEKIYFYSGMIVNDGKLFVVGCGYGNKDVIWIPIANILNDELTEWRHYADLPDKLCDKEFAFGKLDNP